MNPRNASIAPQRYHGNSHPNCGCNRGQHIWDELYETEIKSEKWCVCCEHFFGSDEFEYEATENAVEFPGKTAKPETKTPDKKPGAFRKGKIVRR